MKTTSIVLAAVVAMLLIGCSNNSNPVADNSALNASTQKSSGDNVIAAPGPGGSKNATRIEGTVTGVNVATGTVTIGTRVVPTNSSTKIERNGFHTTLSAIRVGDRGQARIPAGSTIASNVESVG